VVCFDSTPNRSLSGSRVKFGPVYTLLQFSVFIPLYKNCVVPCSEMQSQEFDSSASLCRSQRGRSFAFVCSFEEGHDDGVRLSLHEGFSMQTKLFS
jgi:hypothetical protein